MSFPFRASVIVTLHICRCFVPLSNGSCFKSQKCSYTKIYTRKLHYLMHVYQRNSLNSVYTFACDCVRVVCAWCARVCLLECSGRMCDLQQRICQSLPFSGKTKAILIKNRRTRKIGNLKESGVKKASHTDWKENQPSIDHWN